MNHVIIALDREDSGLSKDAAVKKAFEVAKQVAPEWLRGKGQVEMTASQMEGYWVVIFGESAVLPTLTWCTATAFFSALTIMGGAWVFAPVALVTGAMCGGLGASVGGDYKRLSQARPVGPNGQWRQIEVGR